MKQKNSYDTQMDRIYNDVSTFQLKLSRQTKKTMAKQGVINLYPDGEYKDLAIQNFKEAQQELLCQIKYYDSKRSEAIKFFHENYDKFNEDYLYEPEEFYTSHEVIEAAYEEYYGGTGL